MSKRRSFSLTPQAKDGLHTLALILLVILFFPVMVLWALLKKQK